MHKLGLINIKFFFHKIVTKILSAFFVHYYQLIITTQKLLSLKFHVMYFKMHSSFLHGLKVSSHCEVLPNFFEVVRLACWCFIISSYDILDLDMIQRYAVSVNMDIVLLDHIIIKMMAVTIALIWSIMKSSLAILMT